MKTLNKTGIDGGVSVNPAVHALCDRIAKRCVHVIQAVLREEERGLAVNEFYRVCREEIDKPEPIGKL